MQNKKLVHLVDPEIQINQAAQKLAGAERALVGVYCGEPDRGQLALVSDLDDCTCPRCITSYVVRHGMPEDMELVSQIIMVYIAMRTCLKSLFDSGQALSDADMIYKREREKLLYKYRDKMKELGSNDTTRELEIKKRMKNELEEVGKRQFDYDLHRHRHDLVANELARVRLVLRAKQYQMEQRRENHTFELRSLET